MRLGVLLLLALCVACKKPKRPPERVTKCYVSRVTSNGGAWRFSVSAVGARDGRGKAIATLFDVDPHSDGPNQTLACVLERDTSWTAYTGEDLEGTPTPPSCIGDAPYRRYRYLTISLVPTDPPGEIVACEYDGHAPPGYGDLKTPDDALAELPNPIAMIDFTGGTRAFLRVPTAWVSGQFMSKKGSAEVAAKFSPELAKAIGLPAQKYVGSRPLTAAEVAQPIWGDGTQPNVHFFEVTEKGTIERRGFAFAPLPQKP